MSELEDAIREAITEVAEHEDFATVVAAAVSQVVADLGYFKAAGREYAIRRGTVIEEIGFNTEGQATKWASTHIPPNTLYEIPSRPVGVWE